MRLKTLLHHIGSRVPKRFKSKRFIVIFAILLIAAMYMSRGAADTKKIKVNQAQIKDIASTVTASGTIKSAATADLHFGVAGKLAWVGIEEGDRVTAGQVIATLNSEKYQIDVRQAEQEITKFDAILSQVYDEAKKRSAAENFDDKIRRTKAETDKNQAFDALKDAQRALRDTVLVSPIEGVVANMDVVAGQEVLATTEVAKIMDEETHFVAEVGETEIGNLREGNDVSVLLDAFPDAPVTSVVEKISPIFTTTSTGSTAYEVTINLPADVKYRVGMSGEAEIITQKEEGKLTVPLDSIVDEKFVYLKDRKGYKKVEIVSGLQSDTDSEILSGLSENDQVVIAGFDQISKRSNFQKLFGLFSVLNK